MALVELRAIWFQSVTTSARAVLENPVATMSKIRAKHGLKLERVFCFSNNMILFSFS